MSWKRQAARMDGAHAWELGNTVAQAVCVCARARAQAHKAQDCLSNDPKHFLMLEPVNRCQQLTGWLSWMSVPEDGSLAAVLGVPSSIVTCERINKIGARQQLGFIPLVVGKG